MRTNVWFCAAGLVAVSAAASWAACSETSVDLRPAGGEAAAARFRVEIADDPSEMARGLMHRETLPKSAGMLFIYPEAGPVSFWMRNTLIPLDMIFLGSDGVVRRVHENAVPLDETSIPGGDDIQYVLEINGGLARQLGIEEGSELRHPAIDPGEAAWPCE